MRTGVFDAGGKVAVALAVAGLALAPTIAIAAGAPKPKAIAFSFDQISSFTPAGADPRLAASFAGRPRSITDFRFTPAAAKGRPSQIRVAVRARSGGNGATTPAALAALSTPAATLTPTSYNLGVAVGWKRFAVGGDVSTIKDTNPAIGKRESAVVGVSYSLKKFTGRVAVGSERSDGRVPALAQPDRYSVDVGGAYNLTGRVAVTGGVRYRIDQDKLRAAADQRRDSQAVYVGTAFKF